MAGIGFELNKLTQRDNLFDVFRAFIYTTFAAVGPWIYTIIVLALITLVVRDKALVSGLIDFRTIIIYNFSVSLVVAAPVFMLTTRVLSDAIHERNVTIVPAVLYKSMRLTMLLHLPIGLLWYASDFYTFSTAVAVMAFADLFLIALIWVVAVFLLALKDYMAVSKSFLIGHAIALALIWLGPKDGGTAWLLTAFNVGLVTIIGLLIARVWAEYPYAYDKNFRLMPYLKQYWPLAAAGFFYNFAIWIDKWLMWYAPESIQLASGMRIFPAYDHSMFMAIVFTVPAFVLFVFAVETNFFTHYQRFFGDILAHSPLKRIMKRHGSLVGSVHEGGWQLVMVQGLFTLLAVAFAPYIVYVMEGAFAEIGIFRLGVLGGFFHLLMLTATIILSYFDCRRQNMWIYLLFAVSNMVLTAITITMGYETYGYGYFIASALSFTVAVVFLFHHLANLLYHAFITNNISIK